MDEPVQSIELTGRALRPEQVVLLARGRTRVTIAPEALALAAAAADTAERVAARQPVYGRTTGVGANRTQQVEDGDLDHGLRLLRSHATGIGRIVSPTRTRAMLVVRANQLLAGGSGLRPEIIEAIVAAFNAGVLPEVHEYGSVGTADLTALAELGLTLVGERPWVSDESDGIAEAGDVQPLTNGVHSAHGARDGSSGSSGSRPESARDVPVSATQTNGTRAPGPGPVRVTSGDALALMSSSALTIGRTCLGWREASRWVDAAHAVAALAFVSLSGSAEAYAQAAHERRPYPGSTRSAAVLRALLAGQRSKAARIQDPHALRCIPQVHGAALSAIDASRQVLGIEVNVAAENPLVSVADDAVYHHGGFHQAQLTQALDALNLALLSVGQLSLARLNLLYQPEFTGLRPFLADGAPASSGLMTLEMAAHDALSELRNAAMPAGLGHAALSRGVEDHTPFTSQAARQTTRAARALRLVLATELVGAVRTLRLRGIGPVTGTVLGEIYALVSILETSTADRSSSPDVEVADGLLEELADVVVAATAAATAAAIGDRSEP